MKASSRQNPFIRFEQDKKLFRNALEVEGLTKGFDNGPLFKNLNLLLEVGENWLYWVPTASVNQRC